VAVTEVSAQDGLDTAIRNASDYINNNVPQGSKLVILNIKSEYTPLSEYIIDVLTGNVVNDRVFTVVDRTNLALIQQEMDFQLSGEVSDESAQSIGQKLGAQTIVSGSITSFGNLWRLTIRALGVEDATVLGLYNENIPSSSTLAALTSGPKTVEPVKNPTIALRTDAAITPNTGTASVTQAPAPAPPTPTVYTIGGRGPAGGIVFYDKGDSSGGWQYLEASPYDIGDAPWGSTRTTVGGTLTYPGSGKRNTERIITTLRGVDNLAAHLCVEFDLNGYKDWFLPSKDELNLLYTNLKVNRLGGFSNSRYWSSSEYETSQAWYQEFRDGRQSYSGAAGGMSKGNNYSVRAVRQF
jgi:TolB-like protein